MPLVLTIAGSDSSGGAGIQADLAAFHAAGLSGATAITGVTAQNTERVVRIDPVPADLIELQIETACEEAMPAAVKTGMLYSASIVSAVTGAIKKFKLTNVVVDPVTMSSSGSVLLLDDAFELMCSDLLPLADVMTPNVPEAVRLVSREIGSVDDMKAAAVELAGRFGLACIVKGGHLPGGEAVDVFCEAGDVRELAHNRVNSDGRHGTGCAFSAMLAAQLALGKSASESTVVAKDYVLNLIRQGGR